MSLYEKIKNKEEILSVIGLGYVGLPLAISFAKKVEVIGFDINKDKVEAYKKGIIDVTNEVGNKSLQGTAAFLTSNEEELKKAKFHIIAVPTPINPDKTPNLDAVIGASKIVGRNLIKGSIVVYESTVYTGVTEDICKPILEKESGLRCGIDFKIGYSPERINPGDKVHRLEKIKKVVSGMDEETLDIIAKVYGLIIKAGVYRAESIKVAEAAREINPEALLILGDTNSALSAISAKRLKIPIFHMEAGNRCFDQNVPEEINRKIIDHISDINLPYTEHSRRYLLSEGIRKEHIFVTGSPMPEVLNNYRDSIDKSKVLDRLKLEKNKYILVSAHREENIDIEENFFYLVNSLNSVAEEFKLPVIYSTHPRSWKKIEERKIKFNPLIRKLKPFGFIDYNKLQQNAFCVLSDSGTLSEESSILNFPAVLIRTSTERPEVLDKGSIIIGGIKSNEVIQSVYSSVELFKMSDNKNILPIDYKDTNVSMKVVKIIQSYTKIINKNIWCKN